MATDHTYPAPDNTIAIAPRKRKRMGSRVKTRHHANICDDRGANSTPSVEVVAYSATAAIGQHSCTSPFDATHAGRLRPHAGPLSRVGAPPSLGSSRDQVSDIPTLRQVTPEAPVPVVTSSPAVRSPYMDSPSTDILEAPPWLSKAATPAHDVLFEWLRHKISRLMIKEISANDRGDAAAEHFNGVAVRHTRASHTPG